jgi:hypothetical protein
LIVENVTASQTVQLTHQDAGSSAANRIICESANGQILGPGGRGVAVYDDTTDRWRFTVIDPGAWISVAHGSLTFSASAGTWTVDSGDLQYFMYQQRGTTLAVRFSILNSSTSAGMGTDLIVSLPAGFTAVAATAFMMGVNRHSNNGTVGLGLTFVNTAGTTILSRIASEGNWASSVTNNTSLTAAIEIPIQ